MFVEKRNEVNGMGASGLRPHERSNSQVKSAALAARWDGTEQWEVGRGSSGAFASRLCFDKCGHGRKEYELVFWLLLQAGGRTDWLEPCVPCGVLPLCPPPPGEDSPLCGACLLVAAGCGNTGGSSAKKRYFDEMRAVAACCGSWEEISSVICIGARIAELGSRLERTQGRDGKLVLLTWAPSAFTRLLKPHAFILPLANSSGKML